MNKIPNQPGFQTPDVQTTQQNVSKNKITNRKASFQNAFDNVRNQQLGKQRDIAKEVASLSPTSPTPSPSSATQVSNTSSASTSTGFTPNSTASSGGLVRGNLARGPGLKNDANEQRVQQEMNNQLLQSGLQAQTLKSEPASTREND